MFILSFYLFVAIYTLLFLWIFPVDFVAFQEFNWYLFLLLSILIGSILSFFTQVLILKLLGLVRKNKHMTNVFNHRIANSILKLGLHLIRTKVIVTGKENIPEGQFVLMGNHQENYDILVLKPIFHNHPLSFIAKEALEKLPVFGWWMKILGAVFISKYADRSAAKSIIDAIKNYKDGMCMGIFPEGKRSFQNEMIEFKAGAFKLAMKAKAPILLATQYNTCKILKGFPWRPYRVYVYIHPVIPYEEYQDMTSHEVSDYVRAKIQAQLDIFEKTI
jgi:1-acyl-sn-glycerol-3-phosphate acyltransferase